MTQALILVAALVTSDAASRRDAVVQVVEKVSPAVVYVGTVQVVERRFRSGNPFDDLFFGTRERKEAVEGLGSGVIIDPSGIIVTNDHVIRGAAEIHIVLADGRKLDAEVVGSDADNDLAVLKVQSKTPLPAAKLGTTSDLMIGEKVIAIGSPFGLKKTVTVGVVSAIGRSFKADNRTFNDFVQTDASINPGNSGGPLMNIDGEVIGINTAIFASAQNIGFAIPADKVKRVVGELAQYGKLRPVWVGIDVENLTPDLARRLGWDRTFGALVTSVETGSPAAESGVQRGDIVTQAGNVQVEDAEDFRVRLKSYPARTPLALGLFRSGQALQLTVTPIEFPTKQADTLAWDRLGLRVKAGQGGLVVTGVRPGTAAAQVGLEPGDLIARLNNQPMANVDAFREALIAARGASSVVLLVRRGRVGYHVTLPF